MIRSEGRVERDVGSVTAARNQHPADARDVVARIERVPLLAELHLEPPSEIHGGVDRRDADVTQVAGAVARGDVQAAAQGQR